jgi:hypothetical protein
VHRFCFDGERAPRVLRLESRPGEREREVYLRVKRVAVREPIVQPLHAYATTP